MYYLERNNKIYENLPSGYEKLLPEVQRERGLYPLVDNGAEEELSIKATIEVMGNKAVQVYISEEQFLSLKSNRLKVLGKVYESKVDSVVRKSTQDLVFGDIEVIPADVIVQRDALKAEYHQKYDTIKAANDVPALNAITF